MKCYESKSVYIDLEDITYLKFIVSVILHEIIKNEMNGSSFVIDMDMDPLLFLTVISHLGK